MASQHKRFTAPAGRGPKCGRLRLNGLAAAAAAAIACLVLVAHATTEGVTTDGSDAMGILRGSKHVSHADGLDIAEFCAQEHADVLGQDFNLNIFQKGRTSCTDNNWLVKFQEIADPLQDRVFFDMGANKGYVSAAFFALFAPELGFSPAAILTRDPSVDCGSCADCREEWAPSKPPPAEANGAKVHVVAVEPNLSTFASLVGMRDHFLPANSSRPSAQWSLLNAAVSNTSARTAAFPRCRGGDEQCGLTNTASSATLGLDVVPMFRVADLLDMYDLSYVDVLKMDLEGYDAPALLGAMPVLHSRRVGIVAFEYHGIGEWMTHTLEDVVSAFDGLGFVCYFTATKAPGGSLARMTGCWSPFYEVKGWSNVVCMRRDHELYVHAERETTRYARYQSSYYKESAAARRVQQ